MDELNRVRQKYPQYADMDDMTLATKLAEKYPQYSDLVEKSKQTQVTEQPVSQRPPIFSPTARISEQQTISPTDIIAGTVPLKGMNIIAEQIKGAYKPRIADITGVSKLPQTQIMRPELQRGILPTSPFSIGMKAGGMVTPKQAGEFGLDIALDPRTYLPAMANPKLQALAEKPIRGLLTPRGEPGKLAKAGAFLSGIEGDTLKDVAKSGYRNVLQKKYYNKKIPEQISERIDQNIDNLYEGAETKFKEVTSPLRDTPVDFSNIRQQVTTLAQSMKKNVFKGPTKDLNDNILDGIWKSDVNNYGDLLDLRRNLDEVLYTSKSQGVKSEFGKKIRDVINNYLHQNKVLEAADNEWYKLQTILRENKKIVGETGENYLKRWATLTTKQKQALSELENQMGGEPFVQDLMNYSMAQKFLTRPGMKGGLLSPLRMATKPILRGALRAGGILEGLKKSIK